MAEVADKDKQIADLQKRNAALEAQVKEKDTQLDAAGKVVIDLKQQLAAKSDSTVELPTVTHEKTTYELTSDFYFDGQVVTIETLKEDAKLVAKLVKEGVANLRKVSK